MTYHNAVKYIATAPATPKKGSHSAERLRILCNALGVSYKSIDYLRFTGSSGKTICSKMLSSVLNAAGIANGTLSMPIYSDIRENIRINGSPLSMEQTVKYVRCVVSAVDCINKERALVKKENLKKEASLPPICPTRHEILLCMALLAFEEHGCKICFFESDLAADDPSRFLPTPLAAIICGSIPEGDSAELSKIRLYISRGIREIVSVPQDHVAYNIISDTCSAVDCRLTIPAKKDFSLLSLTFKGTKFIYKNTEYSLRLCGRFQVTNALAIIEACEMLERLGYRISKEHVSAGLAETTVPCKFEILSVSPTIIADSTHSPFAIDAVCDSLADFKSITGTKVKLCMHSQELADLYQKALCRRGYDIDSISVLSPSDLVGKEISLQSHGILLDRPKAAKKLVASCLKSLSADTMLLISGSSNFTWAIRYELLSVLGF